MDPGDGDGERKPSRPLTVPLAFTQLISLLAWYFLPSFLFPIDPGPYLPVYSPPGVIALDGLCVGKKEGLHADGIGNRLLIGQMGSVQSRQQGLMHAIGMDDFTICWDERKQQ